MCSQFRLGLHTDLLLYAVYMLSLLRVTVNLDLRDRLSGRQEEWVCQLWLCSFHLGVMVVGVGTVRRWLLRGFTWFSLTECERNCSQGCLGRTCPRESCTLLLDFAHWIPIGETGATYLFLPLWNIPVQQRQGERGKAYSGTDMLRVVAASGRQQGFQKPTVFLSVRSRMYPSVFPL